MEAYIKETSNFNRARRWIRRAMRFGANTYFHFVDSEGRVYGYGGVWMTPEEAQKEIERRDGSNTVRIGKMIFKQ